MPLNKVSKFQRNACSETNAGCAVAFEDFLTTYESTTPDQTTNALENLNIEEEDFSDEYVMVDDERDSQGVRRRPGQPGPSKKKYMEMLQQVADRQISEVMIELDDLDNVGHSDQRKMEHLR